MEVTLKTLGSLTSKTPIVYPLVVHTLKSLSHVSITMPTHIKTLRRRLGGLKGLYLELKKLNSYFVCGFRMELRLKGMIGVTEGLRLAKEAITDQLPEEVDIDQIFDRYDYFRRIRRILRIIEGKRVPYWL